MLMTNSVTMFSCGLFVFTLYKAQNVGLQYFMWEDAYLRLKQPVIRNVTHHVCRCHPSPVLKIDLPKFKSVNFIVGVGPVLSPLDRARKDVLR